jgi:hypothetical protein
MVFSARILSLAVMLMASGCAAGSRAVANHGGGLPPTTSTSEARLRSSVPTSAELEQGLQAGDYVVYRFSGTFRKPTAGTSAAPLTLTQRVLGREGNVLGLEIVLDDGTKKQTLRIQKDSTPGAAREVFDVVRVEAGHERPDTVEAYEAMMAKTVLAADENEAQLGTERTSILLGGKALTCTKTSYRVRVGTHQATMSTVQSDTFPWGDVAGDITTLEGQVLYRVEVIEAGTQHGSSGLGAVAVAR